MKKGRELDNILDECLERILFRGETVEQCLESYPEQAGELEPLLRTAAVTREATDVRPRPEFRERARCQFQAAIRDMAIQKERRSFGWLPQWATVVVAVVVLVVAGGGGTVAAAQNSMPDGTLYPVKLTAEKVRIALTPSELGKAELYVRLADRRVAEIARMADEGKREQVDETARLLSSHLMAMATLIAPPGEVMLMAPAQPEAAILEAPVPAPRAEEAPPPEVSEAPELGAEPPMAAAPKGPPEEHPAQGPKGRGGGGVKTDKQEKLQSMLANRAAANPAALRAVLQRAPEKVRPALERAIRLADRSYQHALLALD